MNHVPHLTPYAWTSEQQAAFDGLVAAWVQDDDLRRSGRASFDERYESLVQLQTARQAMRQARHGRPTLAA